MKNFLLVLIVIASSVAGNWQAVAQRAQRLTDEDRAKYLTELRNQKHEFLIRELELTRDQQNAFFPIYDEMDDTLNRISEETRLLETKVTNDSKATDTEIESASRAIFEQKSREGEIETQYFVKFKEILKPRQLLSLKNAERKFTQQLVRQHGRLKNRAQP